MFSEYAYVLVFKYCTDLEFADTGYINPRDNCLCKIIIIIITTRKISFTLTRDYILSSFADGETPHLMKEKCRETSD